MVWTDPHSGLQTLRTDLVTDRGISWETAQRMLELERVAPDDQSGFRVSRRPTFGRPMVLLAIQKSAKATTFDIRRPNTGVSFFDMEVRTRPCTWILAPPQPIAGGSSDTGAPLLSQVPCNQLPVEVSWQ